jgi:hypothetical protein
MTPDGTLRFVDKMALRKSIRIVRGCTIPAQIFCPP